MTIHYPAAKRAAEALIHDHIVRRIWDRDISAWGAASGSADARSIETRLGWLESHAPWRPELSASPLLADSVKRKGFSAVYLLGMGGSSLCAEVIASVFGAADSIPASPFSTRPTSRRSPARRRASTPRDTLFIVASKSGGTVEVASMERFFWAAHVRRARRRAGRSSLRGDHGPGDGAAEAGGIAGLSRSFPESRGYRRAVFGAVAVRSRARGAHRRAGHDTRGRWQGDGRGMPAGEPHERRPRARRVHRRCGEGGTKQTHRCPSRRD